MLRGIIFLYISLQHAPTTGKFLKNKILGFIFTSEEFATIFVRDQPTDRETYTVDLLRTFASKK